MQNKSNTAVSVFHISMDDEKLGIKPQVLVSMYQWLDSRARQIAPENVRSEIQIMQDGRVKTRFNITVSDRMTPHLVAAIQQKLENESSIGLRTYFQNLQQQLLVQLFDSQEKTGSNKNPYLTF